MSKKAMQIIVIVFIKNSRRQGEVTDATYMEMVLLTNYNQIH